MAYPSSFAEEHANSGCVRQLRLAALRDGFARRTGAANRNKTSTICLILGLIFAFRRDFFALLDQKIDPALDVRDSCPAENAVPGRAGGSGGWPTRGADNPWACSRAARTPRLLFAAAQRDHDVGVPSVGADVDLGDVDRGSRGSLVSKPMISANSSLTASEIRNVRRSSIKQSVRSKNPEDNNRPDCATVAQSRPTSDPSSAFSSFCILASFSTATPPTIRQFRPQQCGGFVFHRAQQLSPRSRGLGIPSPPRPRPAATGPDNRSPPPPR